MDIPLNKSKTPIWRKPKLLISTAVVLALGLGLLGFAKAGGQAVDAAGISIATVERGPLTLTVQASGVLLPSDIRFIAAQADGRVEQVLVRPGAQVKQGELLVQLSNPALNQLAEETRWSLAQAEAELNALRVSLDSEALNQQATVARAQFAYDSARLQLEAEAKLLKEAIVSKLTYQRSELNVKQLGETLALEKARLLKGQANNQAQLAAKAAGVARLRNTLLRAQEQVAALAVKAPMEGTLQEIALQAGQGVSMGASIAKIARPDALYAELQVQEAQARDLAAGQTASIDTRNGLVAGVVSRVAPKVSNGVVKVDVRLDGTLPRGARPDLSIDGTITVASLADTLHVQRPVFSQGDSPATVYKVAADGSASPVQVQFGAAAVSRIAVKGGLQQGERIVVSDTSNWRGQSKVRIQ